MEKYYIWLVGLLKPANPVIHEILARYGNPKTAYEAISGGDTDFLTAKQSASLSYHTLEKAERVVNHCKEKGYSIITIDNPEYPALLSEIFNPPVVLFYRGSFAGLDKLTITVVGAREITPYISKLCPRVCKDLALNGVTIVSGMARGVDSFAHNACINAGTPTVGVLACGIDFDYPSGSKEMREKIVLNGGAYLTELLPGTSPEPDYFKARNRILAGLSRGTAVFQAGKDSGSLITASYAADEGRDVFCVPPPDIFDDRYAGVVSFLRDGAIPIFNHDDILRQYEGIYL